MTSRQVAVSDPPPSQVDRRAPEQFPARLREHEYLNTSRAGPAWLALGFAEQESSVEHGALTAHEASEFGILANLRERLGNFLRRRLRLLRQLFIGNQITVSVEDSSSGYASVAVEHDLHRARLVTTSNLHGVAPAAHHAQIGFVGRRIPRNPARGASISGVGARDLDTSGQDDWREECGRKDSSAW